MCAQLLLLAATFATHTLVAQADKSFGDAQVEQVICDRPELGAIIKRDPALRALLGSCFAGELSGERVYWDCREPVNDKTAGHFPPFRDYAAFVRLSSRSKVSAIDKCMCLVIELQHSRFDNNRRSLDRMAIQKQITRNDFARSSVRIEFEAAKKAQAFFREHPLAEAKIESDPYYVSVLESSEDFSDYLRWQEGPDSGKDNLLQYYLHVYDQLLSDSANGKSGDRSAPMR